MIGREIGVFSLCFLYILQLMKDYSFNIALVIQIVKNGVVGDNKKRPAAFCNWAFFITK